MAAGRAPVTVASWEFAQASHPLPAHCPAHCPPAHLWCARNPPTARRGQTADMKVTTLSVPQQPDSPGSRSATSPRRSTHSSATSRSSRTRGTRWRRSVPSCASTSSRATTRSARSRATSGSWVYASSKKENNYVGFGTDNDVEHLGNYPIVKHRTFSPSAPSTAVAHGTTTTRCAPLREGPRRPARAQARVPSRLGRQRVGDELRRALGPGHRGAQPRGRARRRHAQHRRGRAVRPPPPGWRPHLPDRHRLLRLPRRARPLRPREARGPRPVGARARDRGQAQPGRQAGPGRAAPRGEDHRGDQPDPRHPDGPGLRQPVTARRVRQRRLDARLGGEGRRRDRPARRHQVGGGRAGLLAGARRRDGRPAPAASTSSPSTAARAARAQRRSSSPTRSRSPTASGSRGSTPSSPGPASPTT